MTGLFRILRSGWTFKETITANFGKHVAITLRATNIRYQTIKRARLIEIPFQVPSNLAGANPQATIDLVIEKAREELMQEVMELIRSGKAQFLSQPRQIPTSRLALPELPQKQLEAGS